MARKFDPKDVYEEVKNNFSSIELFDNLVQSSALYYQEHGSLDMLKLFIPNSNHNHDCLHKWTPEKADIAASHVIRIFTEQRVCNAYLKDYQEDGIYLAFKIESSLFLSFAEYIGEGSYLISQARRNGLTITADEWLRDFPYEFHAAWYNRKAASEEMSILVQDPFNDALAQALYDGKQNWLEGNKYPTIENWNPSGTFTEIFQWADSEDENQRLAKEFRKNYN
jgi:hypothetical protein